jgi:DNA-directed RNA polymerase specialized sigma24 family protein
MIRQSPSEIATGYVDEWGVVAPEVHQAAVTLQEQAENYARVTLHNEATGITLLAKAAAIVTRALSDHPGSVTNLTAYLYQTYKRQVLAELEKERSHERILSERVGEMFLEKHDESLEMEQYILIQELRRRMNPRTRLVFDLLSLGHSFEDIGVIQGRSARAVRNNYYDQVAKLKRELKDDLSKQGP